MIWNYGRSQSSSPWITSDPLLDHVAYSLILLRKLENGQSGSRLCAWLDILEFDPPNVWLVFDLGQSVITLSLNLFRLDPCQLNTHRQNT